MKKYIALFLCLCMILCGCGSVKEEPTQETSLEETEPTTTALVVETDPIIETTKETEPAKKTVTIDEAVVFDNGDFKLIAKEIDFEDNYDVKVKFLAENNSDYTVAFIGNDFTINGITLNGSFYIKLSPGKKANDFIEINKEDLISRGINEIATIQAQDCYIYNDDNSEKVTDFQFSIETSIINEYQQEIDRNGQTVFEKDGITIKYRGIVPGTFGDEELEFFVENESDDNIFVYVDDVSVNGFMIYGNMVAHAYPHCVTYENMDFSSSDMEENDIASIEEVCVTFYGYNQNTRKKVWTTDEIILGRTANVSNASDTAIVLGNITYEKPDGFTVTEVDEISYVLSSTSGDCAIGLSAIDISELDEAKTKLYLPMVTESYTDYGDALVVPADDIIGEVAGFPVSMSACGTYDGSQMVLNAVTTFTDSWYAYTILIKYDMESDSKSDYISILVDLMYNATYNGKESRFDFIQ